MQDFSLNQSFTAHLRKALKTAFHFAIEFGHEEISPAHLLYGLAAEKGSLSSELLGQCDFPVDLLKQELVRQFYTPYLPNKQKEPALRDEVITILTKSVRTAHLYEHPYVGTEHVLACLLHLMDEELKALLLGWHLNLDQLQHQITVVLKSTSKFPDLTETLRELQAAQDDDSGEEPEFPVLETLGKELTDPKAQKQFSPLVGREKELEQVQQIIGRKYKNNPLLIGKPGVGKTALAEGLAKAITENTCAPALRHKRLFMLELGNLVAGTMYRGEFEQRMKMLVEELSENPDIIVFIDEIHTLVGAGSSGQPLDAANILKPALARGDIRCIGATTWEEYQRYLSQDAALTRRFQVVQVNEPDKEQTREILQGIRKDFEQFHHVRISKETLETALDLSERYLTHSAWPDKAIDLLDDASSHLKLKATKDPLAQKKARLKNKISKLQKEKSRCLNDDLYGKAIEINRELQSLLEKLEALMKNPEKLIGLQQKHIHEAVGRRTGINTARLDRKAKPLSSSLYQALSKGIYGQDTALRQLTKSIQRAYSPLKDPHKPLGAFLLMGPSGVGKTETARLLAKELFGSEQSLIKLDMSEYAEKHSLSKLIGAPAGYVGYQDSGILVNAVKQTPLSIVLFDEIEKAHPDLFHLLLQILDEGKLKDNTGKVADFKQTMILLTSNLGIDALSGRMGFDSGGIPSKELIRQEMGSAARQFLRPELLNRLDDIIYYTPLGIQERKAIIRKRLAELNQRLSGQISLSMSDEAEDFLTSSLYKEHEGARSLQKLLKDFIEIPLSEDLWKFKKGTRIEAHIEDQSLKLKQK